MSYEMQIEQLVPVGQKNAISRASLAILKGCSDRAVRQMIEDDNQHGSLIINIDHGYFIPAADEMDLAEWYINREMTRVNEQTLKICRMRIALKDLRQSQTA